MARDVKNRCLPASAHALIELHRSVAVTARDGQMNTGDKWG